MRNRGANGGDANSEGTAETDSYGNFWGAAVSGSRIRQAAAARHVSPAGYEAPAGHTADYEADLYPDDGYLDDPHGFDAPTDEDEMPWRIGSLIDGDGDGGEGGYGGHGGGDDGSDPGANGGSRWRRIGTKGIVAIVAVVVLATAVGLQATDAHRGNRMPWCRDSNSDFIGDPVGDGYGWENNRSCRVRSNSRPSSEAASAATTVATTADSVDDSSTVAPGPPTISDADPAASSETTMDPAMDPNMDMTGSPGTAASNAPAGTGAPAAKGGAPATSGSYKSNLDMIRAQTVRNTNQDNSADKNVPSAQLNLASHYGPRTDYLNNPAGNPEQDFPTEEGGQFRIACEFSHFSYDDPIVFPGQPGASHLHIYFGNTDTNAYTTPDSLLNSGSSTCNGGELNRSAYWAPALIDDKGNARIPERVVVYYKGEGLANGKAEVAPAGASMVSKTNVNTVDNGAGGSIGKFSFVCSDNYSGANEPASNTMVGCDGSAYKKIYGGDDPHMVLEMNVKFPQCWNGQDPTNPANFALPTDGGWYFSNCTGAYNHTLVNLEYFIDYPVEQGENTANWYLSSDVDPASKSLSGKTGGSTVHADWFNGWNHEVNKLWIDNCVNHKGSQPSGCGFGYLTDGGPDGNNPLPGPALKYRQQWTGADKVPVSQLYSQLCPGSGTPASTMAGVYCKPGSMVMKTSLTTSGGGSGVGSASVFCQVAPSTGATKPDAAEQLAAGASGQATL